jgi:RsiW-degrading membrane proteinase PrsW (M82 family)
MTVTLTHPAFLVTFALIQAVVFLLLIRFLDLYEREPLSVLALMAAWGATGAVALSLAGNAIVLGLLPPALEKTFGSAVAGPLVEEAAKGLAVAVAFALSWWAARRFGLLELEGLTDGMVYGAAVGLGFAFTEDLLYLFNEADEQGLGAGLSEYASRVDFFGVGQLGHAVYTAAFGAGLGLATWSRSWRGRLGFPLLGLVAAMLMHAVHNGLPSFALAWRYGLENAAAAMAGRSLPGDLFAQMQATAEWANTASKVADYAFVAVFVALMVLWLLYQRRVIRDELEEEARAGLLDHAEWELMFHYWDRSKWYWQLLWEGELERWRLLRRIHNELVDLAFLKRRLRRAAWVRGRIERRRKRIAYLRSVEAVE